MDTKKIILVVAIVVVAGGLWLWSNNGSFTPTYQGGSLSYSPRGSTKSGAGTGGSTATGGSPVITATPATNPAFSQLEIQYKNLGQLIQFDAGCHSTPSKMVVKSGAKIMIDNRSTVPKTIRLDANSYDLPAYTYRFVTAKTSHTLPYNLGVDCQSTVGHTENETTINIQALISNGL